MNNLKQFYETLNQDIPFNELSVESLDILEQSKAYRSYLNESIKDELYNKWFDAIKYIGNVILCGLAAILLIMLFYNEMLKQL